MSQALPRTGLALVLLFLFAFPARGYCAQEAGDAQPPTDDLIVLPTVVSEAERPHTPTDAGSSGPSAAYLGRFHPLVVHFPIALILVAGLAELLFALRGSQALRDSARFCLGVGAISALASALLGWLAAEGTRVPRMLEDTLVFHRWAGVATALVAALAFLFSEQACRVDASTRSLRLYRLALLATIVLVILAGHFGGTMVFGPDHFD
jgi:uncharacterized membrane protein